MSNSIVHIIGDICPTDDYKAFWDKQEFIGLVAQCVHDSSLVVANLECPATNSNMTIEKCGPCQKAMPSCIETLKKAGIGLISLANNHIKDFGEQGVLDTFKYCNEQEMPYMGAGENKKEAARPFFIQNGGKKVGFLSFAEYEFNGATDTSPGANIFDAYSSLELIQKAKGECNYLIVLYHGGIEHYRYPSPDLQKKCRAIVRMGADVVVCQHSHCIGTYEYYQNGYILYGQGNGVFGYRKGNAIWNEGLWLTLTLNDNGIKADYRLLQATTDGIVTAPSEEENYRLMQMKGDSTKLADQVFIKKSWLDFCQTQDALDLPLLCGWPLQMIRLNRFFKGRLFKTIIGRSAKMASMNFLHCDALREVVTTLLENEIWKKN